MRPHAAGNGADKWEAVDDAVGRVIAKLKETGQYDNTLIVVQSDTGGNYEGGVEERMLPET